MTYFAFLAYFVLIPIVVLLVITWLDKRANRPTPGFDAKKIPLIIGVHVLLALTYTTPWDNYLVATGVWYYNPALVTGLTIGYVPIEEYTFFVVETVLSGLWWWFLARRLTPPAESFKPSASGRWVSFGVLFAAWAFFTAQFFFAADAWNYLGIIFFWALPPIFPQFLFGADILWHYRKLVFWTIFVPGLYLSLMDIVALSATTWQISKDQTLGINFFGILPLEEVAFFFITNVLIGFGMTLMLSNLGWERFNAWKTRGFKGLP
jgi:lycopene cyclase domain-containing protein